MNTHLHCVIFDLDGTLINTAPDVRLALNHMLASYGQPELTTPDIYALLGGGARKMIETAFLKSNVTLQADEIDKAIRCYLEFYKSNPVVETTIYPGVLDVLTSLKNAGIALGICTNKPSVMTKIVLKKLAMDHFFAAVLAGDEVAKPKPDGAHIHDVLKKIGIVDCQAVMVGDSEVDKASAEQAGIPFIGVRYGYDLGQLSHSHMIDHFGELPAILSTISTKGNPLL